MSARNQPSTNDYDTAARFALASFIGWQVAILNKVSYDDQVLAEAIVAEAQSNIKRLMLGLELPLGEVNTVSLTNDNGKVLSELLGQSLDDIADTLEANAQNMETASAATN